MAERHAFVTGGTGFLGRNLIEQLVRQDWQVTALHRPTSDLGTLADLPVRLVAGDILDPASLRRALSEQVEALFHLAADIAMWSGHAARQTRVNVEGTRNVVHAALVAGVRRMVHTSTWNAYGLEQGAISEELAAARRSLLDQLRSNQVPGRGGSARRRGGRPRCGDRQPGAPDRALRPPRLGHADHRRAPALAAWRAAWCRHLLPCRGGGAGAHRRRQSSGRQRRQLPALRRRCDLRRACSA